MKKFALLCVILSSFIFGCSTKDYISTGDSKFDLVFITTNDKAEDFWSPLTKQTDSYFGTVIVPLSTDSVKAISQLQKMMEERQPSTLTIFYTPESEKICKVFCSNNKGKISMAIPVDSPNIWADILPDYIDATKEFYSTYKQRLDLLSSSPFNDDDTTQCVWNYNLSKEETEKIINYFRLDTIICESMNTWEKALNTGKFISDNIPHGNQKSQPEQKDAISIW